MTHLTSECSGRRFAPRLIRHVRQTSSRSGRSHIGSLTVHVLDDDGNPIRGKKGFCNFPGIRGTHSDTYTDGDGVAEFDDVPVCTVELYVNGEHQLNVGVGTSDHEDVTVIRSPRPLNADVDLMRPRRR